MAAPRKTAPRVSRAAFRAAPVQVRVPATSANLGPGFDAFGLALGLHDHVVARVVEEGLQVDVAGEGAGEVATDERHLVVRAMRATFERLGGQPRGLELVCANRIPHGRGLGSSAAAIVAGILAARALTLGGEQGLPDAAVLALASEIEGHPDNVAACLFGGVTIAWTDDATGTQVARLDAHPDLRALALVPSVTSSTEAARGLLPAQVPHALAAANAARAGLLGLALTVRPDLLLAATHDRLHQDFRTSAMPDTLALVGALRAQGLAAVVSGAGPTVLVLGSADDPGRTEAVLAATREAAGFTAHALPVDSGAALVGPS